MCKTVYIAAMLKLQMTRHLITVGCSTHTFEGIEHLFKAPSPVVKAVNSIALNEGCCCSEAVQSMTALPAGLTCVKQACLASQKLTLCDSNSDLKAEALDAFSAPAELPDLAEADAEQSQQSDEPDKPNSKSCRSHSCDHTSAGPSTHSASHSRELEVVRSRSVHDNVQGKLCLAWA